MKYIHMLMAFLVVVLFCYQSYIGLKPDKVQPKPLIIIVHTSYLLMIITGLIMVKPLMEIDGLSLEWVVAKAVLLVAVMSASIKAFRPTAELAQRKMGIFITAVGLASIISLAFTQPDSFF